VIVSGKACRVAFGLAAVANRLSESKMTAAQARSIEATMALSLEEQTEVSE
jgi:hypothetical protein